MGSIVFAFVLAALGGQEKIPWEKAEVAKAKAKTAGKPICWYFTTNKFRKDAPMTLPTTIGEADAAFLHESVLKRRDQFLWVRGDQNLANQFNVQGAPAVYFTDSEGDVYHKATIANAETLVRAMVETVKEKFVNMPVKWGDIVRTGPIKSSFLVVGFEGAEGEALKVWEDKSLVKYHNLIEFVKLDPSKGETAKKWNVDAESPTILICDSMERVLEKVTGKLTPGDLKAAMAKAWKKLEGKK
jgi:hypothetical protein